MKFLAKLITFFCLTIHTFGVTSNIDSLENLLKNSQGTMKVDVWNELFRQYFNNHPVFAMAYTDSALQFALQLEYKKGIATSYNNMGVVYRIRGQFEEALNFYLASYKIHHEINDQEGIAKIFNNIGTVYSIKGDYDKALENYLESYEILKQIGDHEKIVGSLNNIGNVYRELKENDKALDYYEKALHLQEEINNTDQTFDPLTNIGNIYFNRKDYQKALDVYFESLEIERSKESLYGQAYALSNIGITFFHKKEYNMAISFQNQALTLANTIEDNYLLNNIYKALADAHFAADNLMMAYNSLMLYISVKDSLFNEESNRRISELQLQFEFEKNENKMRLIAKNTDIKDLENRNQQITVLVVILGAIVGVSFLIGLYRNFVGDRKL
ncbi:MAG: tetratricopeptide repeat protein [Bacteroidetes bacterium]|nr:tetratricopeptide repeat protein [Bacteroidota bacterium]